jgi:hypothetical protein
MGLQPPLRRPPDLHDPEGLRQGGSGGFGPSERPATRDPGALAAPLLCCAGASVASLDRAGGTRRAGRPRRGGSAGRGGGGAQAPGGGEARSAPSLLPARAADGSLAGDKMAIQRSNRGRTGAGRLCGPCAPEADIREAARRRDHDRRLPAPVRACALRRCLSVAARRARFPFIPPDVAPLAVKTIDAPPRSDPRRLR